MRRIKKLLQSLEVFKIFTLIQSFIYDEILKIIFFILLIDRKAE